nr:putative ribonuclease H-like domain-containing protein [Tanacetum cinerariifolium]
MNKLVKGNLIRGLPSKIFQHDNSCVACQKGKQHKASYKAKLVNTNTKPLHMLHMDLFGPTNVKSLMKKSYCLVITNDIIRFSWVFFLATKNETSGILKIFITGIENQLDCKVKVIRSDNGTEFKNSVMTQFCDDKGIKREYIIARTPQQNGIVERRNRTLIEAARTMLVDSKLPTTYWAEAVNTACYVLNRALVTKPHNKTPYKLIRGRPPLIDFMKPFGCLVTILNTKDNLGKFEGKADEGYFVGTNSFEEHSFERLSPFKNAFSLPNVPMVTPIDDTGIFSNAYDDDVFEEEVDMNNVDTSYSLCEVISKWKAGLKENMDDRPDVYATRGLLHKTKGNVLGMEIVRDQNVGSHNYQAVYTRSDIASSYVGMLDRFDYVLPTDVQFFVDFDYAMGYNGGYLAKGTHNRLRIRAKDSNRYCYKFFVKGSSPSEVPAQARRVDGLTKFTPYTRRNGKEKMVETHTPKKKKRLQEQIDIQFAKELEEETKKQNMDFYMAVIRSNLGWKVKDSRGMTFEEVKAKFNSVWKQIEDFIAMGSKEEDERIKRKGINLEQESVKKQKISEETHTQHIMHALVEWRLYDTCGVHHVMFKDLEIFMLVEKNYPLRKALALVMICYKLQVENYSQMAADLVRKIQQIAGTPSLQGSYPQWQLRFLRYIDTRPNGDALRKCILSGPYKPTTFLVQAVAATDDSPAIPEHTTVETPMNMSPENKAHFQVEKEAIHLILTGIRDEIYSTVDTCQTAQEI